MHLRRLALRRAVCVWRAGWMRAMKQRRAFALPNPVQVRMAGQVVRPMAGLSTPPLSSQCPLDDGDDALAACQRGISQLVRPKRQKAG